MKRMNISGVLAVGYSCVGLGIIILRILVTGSTGFLGGRLIQYLKDNTSYSLLLGTRDTAKNPDQFNHLDIACLDWSSQEQLEQVCKDVDCIIHLAGMNASRCAKASKEELASDVQATEALLKAASVNKVKRFIYLSSAHVYSSHLSGKIDERTETTNPHPYAVNHRAKERLILHAADRGDIEGIVIRLSNAFGAPVDCKADCWMLLVNDLCLQVAKFGKLTLKTAVNQKRDFIPIGDVCRGIAHLIHLPLNEQYQQVFNLGGMHTLTLLEMAELVSARYSFLTNQQITQIERLVEEKNQDSEFEYVIDKIISTGYLPTSDDGIYKEIDFLILFCLESMAFR